MTQGTSNEHRASAPPKQRYKLYYGASLVGLACILLCLFTIAYTLSVTPPEDPAGFMRIVYFVMAAGFILLFAQALLVFKRLFSRLGDDALKVTRLESELHQRMEHDELTSVFNRAKFTEIAARELDTLRRYEMPLSGILFDIDHFRAVNENAGYTTGDKILITLARYVSSKVRKTDYVFRWRGGKFLILAPHTSADKATIVAEKFRKIIEQKLFGDQTRLTISLGVAAARADDTVDDFAHRLQAALTGAKQNGRNTVVAIK